ncbi:MAG: glycosyl hydrolase family 28-related protein [Planctomycetota bacterium]
MKISEIFRVRASLTVLVMFLGVATGARGQGSDGAVEMPAEYVSVADFTGTANERIEAAMVAAAATDHKTVFFPNGTYALRGTVSLNRGPATEIHLVGESREGVLIIPDIPYLEANYNDGEGARLAHMINLSGRGPFESVDVSIHNMTLDMMHPLVREEPLPETYNVVGHGVRIGTGWREGQFTVNELTIRHVGSYGIGIQDRGGHPKSNVTLTNIDISYTGSDAIDTKEGSGDGSRNLVIRNLKVKEIGFLDTGAAVGIDVRYRDVVIEDVHLVSEASRSRRPGQKSSNTGINFRPNGGVLEATVSGVTIEGFGAALTIHSTEQVAHQNISLSDFKIRGYRGVGIRVLGPRNSGHTISDGYVYSDRGRDLVLADQEVTVSNVTRGPWPEAATPTR